MRIAVDQARCQGHTLCALGAPDLFELSEEDGHAQPAVDIVPSDRREAAQRAELDCPERTISLTGNEK
ncbi:MAG: ferredoxin [Rhodococcus sp. (in: high G+C Gram-positive bacteria)]|uniref:ferredoxin n=1 Tax=Rhodococcus sp. TaxID=1831 RepID=UPI003BAFEA9C